MILSMAFITREVRTTGSWVSAVSEDLATNVVCTRCTISFGPLEGPNHDVGLESDWRIAKLDWLFK